MSNGKVQTSQIPMYGGTPISPHDHAKFIGGGVSQHSSNPRQAMPAEHVTGVSNAGRAGVPKGIVNGPGGPFNPQQFQQTGAGFATWPTGVQVLGADGLPYDAPQGFPNFYYIKSWLGQLPGRIFRKIPDQGYVQGSQMDRSTPDFGRNIEALWQPDGKPTVPPMRICRPMQSDIGSWNGLRQHGFAQSYGGMTDTGALNDASGGAVWPPAPDAGYDGRSLILTPQYIPRPTTTGVRSISGVMARAEFVGGATSNRRIPAVFVPVQV